MFTYEQYKRIKDVLLASLALIILSPIMIMVALLIKSDGGPIFYGHKRVGYKGKLFTCWKFRSMHMNSEHKLQEYLQQNPQEHIMWHEYQKLKQDPRVTWVGAWIRKLSVDELPQLWNVIKGEMAIVGPRPVTRTELAYHYHVYADCYASVRPGITGLWQVSGRSNVSYDERVRLDMKYVHSVSWIQDWKIMWQTVGVVLMQKGAC